jgi:hypothetical protein
VNRGAIALLLVVSACSHDFDSLYEGSGDAAGSGGGVQEEELWLPALPDRDHRDDCERCVRSKCAAQHAECLKDDDCIDELQCKGGQQCDDPACLQTCNAEDGWSQWFADYWNCAFDTGCASECNAGNNWECQHDYQWPNAAANASTFQVEFVFENSPTFYGGGTFVGAPVGATIRACPDDPECSELDSAPLESMNAVELQLVASPLKPRNFRGYLEVDHGDGVNRWRHYPPPLSQAQRHFVGVGGAGTFGPPGFDPGRARVRAIVSDCLGAPVAGARVTLPDMPEIPAFTINGAMAYEEGLTTGTGVAELVDLPNSAVDDRVRVRAEREATDELIAEHEVWVRPGFMTRLWLGPASLSD